ncbi:MAG: aldose 1-epimerase family protein [Victivallaceae bacterium]|nr:aldose 1-epimerase family protein [Victivallaceae bacterium]
MILKDKKYNRKELERRTGNISQLGGVRSYELREGSSKGTRAYDFRTGSGFDFTLLPDRCLDISLASWKGMNLVYLTPNGEVNPAFYSPQDSEWLRNFFGGLLTTCGFTYFGPPCVDGDEALGLHGRATNSPAKKVCDLSGWDGDEYLLKVSGIIEECSLFGDKLRLTRTVSAGIGEKRLFIEDCVENFGFRESPFNILYHINPGFPLLDEGAKLLISAEKCIGYDLRSEKALEEADSFSAPQKDFEEQNFYYQMLGDEQGMAQAALVNPVLQLGLYLRFPVAAMPWLSEWKMLGESDYVVGLEPCNTLLDSRPKLREQGILPMLEPGEQRKITLEIGVLDGAEEITEFTEKTENIKKSARGES